MGRFAEKYTDEQREAVAIAYEDRKLGSYTDVARLAAAGELHHKGVRLEPFEMPSTYISTLVANLRKRRAGKVTSQLSEAEPRDAIETLRRRLINAADAELAAQEKRKDGDRDIPRLQQIGRLIREAQAIPGPKEPRKPAPGRMVNGEKGAGGITQTGLGGAIMADMNGSKTKPAQDNPTLSTDAGSATLSATAGHATADETETQPGSQLRDDSSASPVL